MLPLFLLATLGPATQDAQAAAYYFPAAGLRGMARGGAIIAGVDDLSAQYWNPAALVRLGEGQAYLNMSFVRQDVSFQRIDYNEDGSVRRQFAPVTNDAPMMTIPQFAVGSSFGLEKTYFALGFHPPFAPRLDYPETGAQRYALQDSLVLQWYAGPSVAHKVLPWLTIGAGVFWSPVNASQTIDLMICQDETPNGETTVCKTDFSDQADPNKAEDDYAAQSDVTVGVDMWDWNNITWNVGLLAEPTDWLAIGVSVLPPMKVSGKGSLAVEFGDEHWMYAPPIEAIDGTSYADQDVVVGLTLPWVVRGGVAVKPTDRIEVELAGTWQRWQMTKEIRVSDVNVVVKDNPDNDINTEDIPITDDVVLPANYVNAWSVHLGGDVDATDWLTVRAGTYYETSAVPGATQTVAVVDGNKIGYGLGATSFLGKHWSVEGAFSQGFIAERNIKDSQAARQEIPVDLLAALNGEIDATLGPGAIVGNGIFSSKMTYISAGLTYYFGK